VTLDLLLQLREFETRVYSRRKRTRTGIARLSIVLMASTMALAQGDAPKSFRTNDHPNAGHVDSSSLAVNYLPLSRDLISALSNIPKGQDAPVLVWSDGGIPSECSTQRRSKAERLCSASGCSGAECGAQFNLRLPPFLARR